VDTLLPGLLITLRVVCGKSTLVALMASILQRKTYEVMALDGDASNPEGLVRWLFGVGVEGELKPL
jgi:CO dehydrogenase maturation factor